MPDPEPLIIAGSSVRAAAQSAVHAGFTPWCIDQFGDRDLAEISDDFRTVTDWPNEIASAIQSTPQAEWVYTGALENHRGLIENLSRQRSLCGCGNETLSKLRDPIWLADSLIKASLPSLPVIVPVSGIPESGEWIVKPLASAAGIGVHELPGGSVGTADFGGHYLQRKARGRVISGLYLGVENSALLIGMCEQVCRGSDAGDLCYAYSGSFGPLAVADDSGDVFARAHRIGSAIAAGVRAEGVPLRGLFGIDFVLDDETGELWTLEINPRYTASAEIYERAFGWPLMRWHVDACRGRNSKAAASLDSWTFDGGWPKHGKLIVYAEHDFAAPDIVPLVRRLSFNSHAESTVSVSDIPHVGTLIQKDEPVCTLLTARENLSTCRKVLTAASCELLTAIGEFAG